MERVQSFIDGLFTLAGAKAVAALLLTALVAVVGADWLAYQILFILVVIDFVTGFLCGVKMRCVSSRKASRTAIKLLVYILLVISAHQLTRYAGYLIWLEEFLVIYLAITEMLSIIENAHKLGVPVPEWVVEKLEGYLQRHS